MERNLNYRVSIGKLSGSGIPVTSFLEYSWLDLSRMLGSCKNNNRITRKSWVNYVVKSIAFCGSLKGKARLCFL